MSGNSVSVRRRTAITAPMIRPTNRSALIQRSNACPGLHHMSIRIKNAVPPATATGDPFVIGETSLLAATAQRCSPNNDAKSTISTPSMIPVQAIWRSSPVKTKVTVSASARSPELSTNELTRKPAASERDKSRTTPTPTRLKPTLRRTFTRRPLARYTAAA